MTNDQIREVIDKYGGITNAIDFLAIGAGCADTLETNALIVIISAQHIALTRATTLLYDHLENHRGV